MSKSWVVITLRFFVIVIVFPATFTVLCLSSSFYFGDCILARFQNDNSGQQHGELYCSRYQWHLVVGRQEQVVSPPSIATLTSKMLLLPKYSSSTSSFTSSSSLLAPPPDWYQQEQQQQVNNIDNNDASTTRIIQIQSYAASTKQASGDATASYSSTTTITTSYGFRKNPKKANTNKARRRKSPIPWTTVLLFGINFAIFVWLSIIQQHQVNDWALNHQIYQDYGRAISGNLSHVQPWHLGFNMMSLSSLGIMLEVLYGSLPLLLWTISFLALNTVVVLLLHHVMQRYFAQFQSNLNMIGFSGILFVYMVVTTLQSSHEPSCPIFFMPSLCFETYELFGGSITVNLGPLVQLVVLQFIIPRASFMGHLAGIIVGFFWHWNLLPALDYSQPAVVFPILWMIGKKQTLLVSGGNRTATTTTMSSGDTSSSHDKEQVSSSQQHILRLLQAGLILHYLAMHALWYPWNSIILSELLILIMSFYFCTGKQYLHGVVGCITTIWMTDGMTLAGWIQTRSLFDSQVLRLAIAFLASRWILWFGILLWMIHHQDFRNTRPPRQLGDESTATVGVGYLLEWAIIDPCRHMLKELQSSRGKRLVDACNNIGRRMIIMIRQSFYKKQHEEEEAMTLSNDQRVPAQDSNALLTISTDAVMIPAKDAANHTTSVML